VSRKLRLLDAFCCAGGSGMGFHRAGFDEIVGVDLIPQPHYPFEFHQGDALEFIAKHGHEFDFINASPPCFPAGTPVITARGVVPIESITKGELVLTHEGRWRHVMATMSRQAEVVADAWMATTADHPFYSRAKSSTGLGEPEWTPAADLVGRFVAVPNVAEPLVIPPIPGRDIELGSAFWYMIGRWLGDGWVRIKEVDERPRKQNETFSTEPRPCVRCGKPAVRHGRWTHLWNAYCSNACAVMAGQDRKPKPRSEIYICCAREETDGLASKLTDTTLAWNQSEERTTTRFVSSHVGLAHWMVENFGRYSHGKTLPGWIFGAPHEARAALLDGYLDADGSITRYGWSAGTVSANLAIGMRVLASTLGYGTGLSRHVPAVTGVIEGRVVNQSPLWNIRVNHPDQQRQYGHDGDKHRWVMRRSQLLPRGVETVYDLTVDEDHSFVAWGFVVHNCKKNTSLKAFSAAHHVELIPQTRELLNQIGVPYVIENVVGAAMIDPIMLCGSMFGLGVRRHRLFESNLPLQAPKCDHAGQAAASPGYPTLRYHSGKPIVTMSPVVGVYGRGQGLGPGEVALWRQAMGIDWMARDEMREAIPPAFTEFLGRQVIPLLQANAA
jgi:hypothetical protein